jgi:hypothetical protein
MERIEDRSKALSYIGIEVADALKVIPAPVEEAPVELIEEESIVIPKPVKNPRARTKAKAAPAPTPVNVAAATTKKKAKVSTPILQIEEEEEEIAEELSAYTAATTFERKPSLMERIRNSKLVRAATYLFRIKIRIELPNALPEGRGDY